MSSTLPAVVVGIGRAGAGYDLNRRGQPPISHAGAYDACARTDLVAAADPSEEARRTFEERWGAPAYSDAAEALERHGPALVSVCTPPAGRVEVVRGLCASGGASALWIEKPLAGNAGEAAELVALCAAAGIPLQVNFNRRFDPLHRRCREAIAAGGTPIQADFRFSGPLADYAHHALDLFRWFVGEPDDVGALRLGDGRILSAVSAAAGVGTFLQVETAPTHTFDATFVSPGARVELTGLGEEATFAVARPTPLVQGAVSHGDRVLEGGGLAEAMPAAAAALAAHLVDGDPLVCTGEDGVAALRLLEAIESAAR